MGKLEIMKNEDTNIHLLKDDFDDEIFVVLTTLTEQELKEKVDFWLKENEDGGNNQYLTNWLEETVEGLDVYNVDSEMIKF
jgi:hypothetical protein